MTIQINKIHGDRHSVCRDDAYAVVEITAVRQNLLGILPCDALDGKTREALRSTFLRSIDHCSESQAREAVAVFQQRKPQPVPA